jgi:hypothetical protein
MHSSVPVKEALENNPVIFCVTRILAVKLFEFFPEQEANFESSHPTSPFHTSAMPFLLVFMYYYKLRL